MLVIISVRRLDNDRIEIGVARPQHDLNPTYNYPSEKEVRAVLSHFGISEELIASHLKLLAQAGANEQLISATSIGRAYRSATPSIVPDKVTIAWKNSIEEVTEEPVRPENAASEPKIDDTNSFPRMNFQAGIECLQPQGSFSVVDLSDECSESQQESQQALMTLLAGRSKSTL